MGQDGTTGSRRTPPPKQLRNLTPPLVAGHAGTGRRPGGAGALQPAQRLLGVWRRSGTFCARAELPAGSQRSSRQQPGKKPPRLLGRHLDRPSSAPTTHTWGTVCKVNQEARSLKCAEAMADSAQIRAGVRGQGTEPQGRAHVSASKVLLR